jgi:hypothetical protein
VELSDQPQKKYNPQINPFFRRALAASAAGARFFHIYQFPNPRSGNYHHNNHYYNDSTVTDRLSRIKNRVSAAPAADTRFSVSEEYNLTNKTICGKIDAYPPISRSKPAKT